MSEALIGTVICDLFEEVANHFGMKFQLPGESLEVNDDEPWLELIQIRNNPSGEYWGKSRTYRGTFRILLHWPNRGVSINSGVQKLEEIKEFFPKGQLKGGVQLYDNPRIDSMITENGKIALPLTLLYSFFAAID